MISSRDIVEITISIHAPTRGATSQAFAFVQAMSYFNPRSYKRSDKQPFLIKRWMSTFQSTLLQEERHHRLILMISARIFQSTLLQEERLFYFHTSYSLSDFNPRSYKRSDGNLLVNFRLFLYFNPRSYKRSDVSVLHLFKTFIISIHAPTRGATAKMHNIPYASLQ